MEKIANEVDEDHKLTDPEKVMPSKKKAQEFREISKVDIRDDDEKQLRCCCAPVGLIGKVGVGVELYFRFIIFLALLFFLLSVANIPIYYKMYKDLNGLQLNSKLSYPLFFSIFTIGSFNNSQRLIFKPEDSNAWIDWVTVICFLDFIAMLAAIASI